MLIICWRATSGWGGGGLISGVMKSTERGAGPPRLPDRALVTDITPASGAVCVMVNVVQRSPVHRRRAAPMQSRMPRVALRPRGNGGERTQATRTPRLGSGAGVAGAGLGSGPGVGLAVYRFGAVCTSAARGAGFRGSKLVANQSHFR